MTLRPLTPSGGMSAEEQRTRQVQVRARARAQIDDDQSIIFAPTARASQELCAICGIVDAHAARAVLEGSGWDLAAAVEFYFATGADAATLPVPYHVATPCAPGDGVKVGISR